MKSTKWPLFCLSPNVFKNYNLNYISVVERINKHPLEISVVF